MSSAKTKTQKKIDNHIREALTRVCDRALDRVDGFQWLTHQADFTNFPASLLVTCVFEQEQQRQQAEQNGDCQWLQKQCQAELLKVGVKFKSLPQQVRFDSEEACNEQQQGDWQLRLLRLQGRAVVKNRPH